MKVIIVALALVAVAAAAPIDSEPQILRFDNTQDPEGSYQFLFETENGINRQEEGQLKTVQNEENKAQNVVVVKGGWSYTDPDGNVQSVSFYADENGYHADGPSVPKNAARR